MENRLKELKKATKKLQILNQNQRANLILNIASAIEQNMAKIIKANLIDLQNAKDLSPALQDRLKLDEVRIKSLADGIRDIAMLKDPIGKIHNGWSAKSGLKIEKISVPLGVIAMIYESRPNVTADAFALCFKTGNAVILKGGADALHSNLAITKVIRDALCQSGIHPDAIQLIDSVDRTVTNAFMKIRIRREKSRVLLTDPPRARRISR